MCYKYRYECEYNPNILHKAHVKFKRVKWEEGKYCLVHDAGNPSDLDSLYINDSIEDKVYLTQVEAYEEDFDRNPEYHGCKDWSMAREEEVIWEMPYSDLNDEQKEYARYLLMMI